MKLAPQDAAFQAWPKHWPLYDSLTQKQQQIVRRLVFAQKYELVRVRAGDRWLVVPPGGVVFSERKLAAAALTSRGNVIDTLELLVRLEEAFVFKGGSATWPKPKGPSDPGHDPCTDPLHSPNHRKSPSLLLWRRPERFRVKSIDLSFPKDDPSHDPARDPCLDPFDGEKPNHLRVVGGPQT